MCETYRMCVDTIPFSNKHKITLETQKKNDKHEFFWNACANAVVTQTTKFDTKFVIKSWQQDNFTSALVTFIT